MRYETLLKVDTFVLVLAVVAIVALLVLFCYVAKDNVRQRYVIEMQEKEIGSLYKTIEDFASDDMGVSISQIASEMLDEASVEDAVKKANDYYENVKESLTAELWKQYRERQSRSE
jgi:hypothetical protein